MANTSQKAMRPSGSQEFTAIVLAGLGGNLTPYTNPENLPKALLPLANKALISYPLAWLEKAGISTIFILCLDTQETAISNWIRNNWKGFSRPMLVAASSEEEIVGSADAVRTLLKDNKYKDKVRSDVVIISCDTICEVPPHELLDFHRLSQSSFTSTFHHNHGAEIITLLRKGSKSFTAYEESSNTLLYTSSEADLEDELPLRTSMLWKYPHVILTTAVTDFHLYVCKRWVLDIIVAQEAIARINTDLLPLLCKAQFQSVLREKYSIDDSVAVKIYLPDKAHFCARANIKQNYIDLNKHLLKGIPADQRQPSSVTIGERTTVGPDSALGPDTTIDEKTTIKRSLLGTNIKIGKMCRVTGCIIMDGVKIGDQAKLENCVVCVGAVIGEKATLKDCTIGGNVTIDEKSERKGEEIVMGGQITIGED